MDWGFLHLTSGQSWGFTHMTDADNVQDTTADETADQVSDATSQVDTDTPKPQGKTFDEAYVKQLRDEAAANRKKATDAEKRLKALEDANLTDAQKKDARLKELEALEASIQTKEATWTTRERELLTENAVALAVVGVDPEVADIVADLMKKSPLLVQDEDTGRPTADSLKTALAQIKKDRPRLFAGSTTLPSSGGANNPAKKSPLTRSAIDAMTPTERQARHDEIMQWMKEQ